MHIRRSLTSRLRFAAAVCVSAFLAGAVSGCGAGDPAQQGSDSGTRLLAQAPSAAAAPVAPGNIRMHFHRVQNDTAQWGVYSWDGPQKPSSAWISDRFMFANTDGFGGYVDIPLAAGKSAIWFLVTDGTGFKNCGADQHADLNADVSSRAARRSGCSRATARSTTASRRSATATSAAPAHTGCPPPRWPGRARLHPARPINSSTPRTPA
jgi:hypothetical protein